MNSAVLTASLTGRIQFFYYVALLRTTRPLLAANYCDQLVMRPSPLCCTATSMLRRALARIGLEVMIEGTSPRALGAPDTSRHPGECPCYLAVEVRKAARRWRCPTFARRFRTSGIPLPLQNPLPPSARGPEAPRPVSGRGSLQGACQSPPRRERDSMRSHIPHISMALAMRSPRAFTGCGACGETRCHPV